MAEMNKLREAMLLSDPAAMDVEHTVGNGVIRMGYLRPGHVGVGVQGFGERH